MGEGKGDLGGRRFPLLSVREATWAEGGKKLPPGGCLVKQLPLELKDLLIEALASESEIYWLTVRAFEIRAVKSPPFHIRI